MWFTRAEVKNADYADPPTMVEPKREGSTMVGACIPNPANPAASSHLT
jgi:hypothetical protein